MPASASASAHRPRVLACARTFPTTALLFAALSWFLAATALAESDAEARNFLERAALADRFEIASAEIALERGGQTLQPLANLLLADHQATTARLTELADEYGLQLPDAFEPGSENLLKRLREVSAADFDRTFLEQQLAAHEAAVALYGGYATEGQEASLRAFAAEVLPVLNAHLDKIKALLATQ